jgi:hypothetical protein
MLKHNKVISKILTIAVCASLVSFYMPTKASAIAEPLQLGSYNVQLDKGQAIKEATDKNGITWGYQELSDGTIIIDYAKNIKAQMEIPAELNGKTVTAIGGMLYKPADAGPEWRSKDVDLLQSIKIPSTVKVIGNSVGNCVFSSRNLTNVELPATTWVGHYAFDITPWFEKQRNSQGFVIINDILLSAKNQSGEVTIPSNVKEIGSSAFCNLDEQNNSNMTGINIPNSVKVIGERAFYNCSNLKNVVIPNGVTEIGAGAFEECKALQDIVIPDSVKEIGDEAFWACRSLKKIKIPNNGIHLSDNIFHYCEQLNDIDLPITAVVESNAFNGTPWIEKERNPDGSIIINNVLMNAGTQKEEFKVPSNVKVIGRGVFSGWTNLKKVQIPSGVTKIGENAFEECTNLETIEIPSSVEEIGAYAFISCSKLNNVTFHEGLKTIGMGAFTLCKNVKEFKIPSTVIDTSKDSAFDQGVTITKNGTSYANVPKK